MERIEESSGTPKKGSAVSAKNPLGFSWVRGNVDTDSDDSDEEREKNQAYQKFQEKFKDKRLSQISIETTEVAQEEEEDVEEETDAFGGDTNNGGVFGAGMIARLKELKVTQKKLEEKEVEGLQWTVPYVMVQWLRKRGRAVPTELSKKQKAELTECFNMIDADGSGAIDVEEMHTAFTFLGIRMSVKEVEQLFEEVDEDGSGEIEFQEFVEVMTSYKERQNEQEQDKNLNVDKAAEVESDRPLPFPMMALAYKRKKLMQDAFDPKSRMKTVMEYETKKNRAEFEDKLEQLQQLEREKEVQKTRLTVEERLLKELEREEEEQKQLRIEEEEEVSKHRRKALNRALLPARHDFYKLHLDSPDILGAASNFAAPLLVPRISKELSTQHNFYRAPSARHFKTPSQHSPAFHRDLSASPSPPSKDSSRRGPRSRGLAGLSAGGRQRQGGVSSSSSSRDPPVFGSIPAMPNHHHHRRNPDHFPKPPSAGVSSPFDSRKPSLAFDAKSSSPESVSPFLRLDPLSKQNSEPSVPNYFCSSPNTHPNQRQLRNSSHGFSNATHNSNAPLRNNSPHNSNTANPYYSNVTNPNYSNANNSIVEVKSNSPFSGVWSRSPPFRQSPQLNPHHNPKAQSPPPRFYLGELSPALQVQHAQELVEMPRPKRLSKTREFTPGGPETQLDAGFTFSGHSVLSPQHSTSGGGGGTFKGGEQGRRSLDSKPNGEPKRLTFVERKRSLGNSSAAAGLVPLAVPQFAPSVLSQSIQAKRAIAAKVSIGSNAAVPQGARPPMRLTSGTYAHKPHSVVS